MIGSKSGDPAIDVVDLRKTYREGWIRPKQQEALKGISLRVERGEIFGLLGGNGAGKTTFIKILLGIIRRTSGQATLLGYPAGDKRGRQLVGYLPENLRVPRHMTGLVALEYYGNLSGLTTSEVRKRRGPLLEKVGLAVRAKDPVRTYSKGMLQRLGLAQAMLHDPDIYILDEPTDGLDPSARAQVRSFLADLKQQGKTVFLNSHILQEVELICDRVAILDRGNLKQVERVENITSGRLTKNGSADARVELIVTFDLQGPPELIASVLASTAITSLQQFTPLEQRVVAKLGDQTEVDAIVDRLRSVGVSVVGLSRQRMSLEQHYLEIVAQAVTE